MFYVATLISSPDRPAVTDDLAQKAARYLPHGRPVDWLAPGVAMDIAFLGDEFERRRQTPAKPSRLRKDLAQDLRDIVGGEPVDVVIQPQEGRRKKLLLADMDSTMIGQECIDELADYAGFKERVAAITERAMRGEIAFEPALRERVALLKGLPAAVIDSRHRRAHPVDARRPDPGRHHAGERRLYVSGVRRLHRVHVEDRRHDRLRREPRQHATGRRRWQAHRRSRRPDPRPRSQARDAARIARALSARCRRRHARRRRWRQ